MLLLLLLHMPDRLLHVYSIIFMYYSRNILYAGRNCLNAVFPGMITLTTFCLKPGESAPQAEEAHVAPSLNTDTTHVKLVYSYHFNSFQIVTIVEFKYLKNAHLHVGEGSRG